MLSSPALRSAHIRDPGAAQRRASAQSCVADSSALAHEARDAHGQDGRHDLIRAPGRADRYWSRWRNTSRRGCRASRARSTAEKTPTGQSNPTFLLASPSGRYVLRKKPPGQLLKSAHAGRPRVPRHEGAARTPTCRCRACCTCARTTASSAPRSSSWSSSTARCSGTRRCRS